MGATLQPKVLRFQSVDSTNLEAIRQAKCGAPEGLCIVAEEQTAGRGRLDRNWYSPKAAGLYFSLLLRPSIQTSLWPLFTLMTALAVSEALMKSCGLRTDIKWPNDICVNGRKLCGILAETVETPSGPAAVIGIGINLRASAVSDGLRASATSVEVLTGRPPNNEKVLAEVLKAIDERYQLLQSPEGRKHTIREWCANSSFAFDRQVRFSLGNEMFEGTTRGLENDGALRVELPDGRMKIVRAGEVTAVRAGREFARDEN
jgi:BirA family biotin operon repressor/biotin-[acetyl-CoA-carboxylase] ligase